MSTHEVFLAVLAREYYEENVSKVGLAKKYGISRFQAARLLEEARAKGIVRIEIRLPESTHDIDTTALAERLGLARIVLAPPVVPGTEPGAHALAVRTALARATAEQLSNDAFEGATIGVSWSRTLAESATYVTELPRCEFVQLAGAIGETGPNASAGFLYRLGHLADAPTRAIWAPLFVDDAATADGLYRQPEIAETLARADHLDMATVAFGSWQRGVSTVFDRAPAYLRRRATQAGAVLECSGRLFDAQGAPVSVIDDQVVAVTREQLRHTPRVIGVAAGATTATTVIAATRTGIFDTLIVGNELAAVLDANLDELLGA